MNEPEQGQPAPVTIKAVLGAPSLVGLAEIPVVKLTTRCWQDVNSMPLIWKLPAIFYVCMLQLILSYFWSDLPINLEKLKPEPDPNAPKGLKALLTYFQSGRQLNRLYVIAPIPFVVTLVLMNEAAGLLLRGSFIKSLWNETYSFFAGQFRDPRWIRDFTLDVRPLLLTWLALVPPIGILFALVNALITVWRSLPLSRIAEKRIAPYKQECLVLKQNIDQARLRPREFYNSTWFNPVMALPYVLGVPAIISLWIYFQFGVDFLLGFPSRDPLFRSHFVIIGLYLYGLSWCLCSLFMRSYFTLCWNFTSQEYHLELYPDMIKALPSKGWFFDFLTLAARRHQVQIHWDDVVSVKFSTARLTIDNNKRENGFLTALKKVASLFESVAKKMQIHTDVLEITGSSGKSISVRLWELSADEKLKVFEMLRKYCPSIYLDDKVQEALVGSSVMKEPQYTEIWFSVLAADEESRVEGKLKDGHVLNKGKYVVSSMIASGGQAVLYAATDASAQTVVLKEFQLTPGESFNAKIESAKDFENESAILAQLSHDSIVKMLDMFYENGRIYIVLEQVNGKTLRQIVSETGAMDSQKIMELARQMSSILSYLHELQPPVVHRDFTPDNIILQPNGKLKLIDFSIAERKQKKAQAGCAGKHSYTPPEQFAGAACPQSDIYALGATLYFLATGTDPVPITSLTLPNCQTESDEQLSVMINKCTQLELKDRFETVEVFYQAFFPEAGHLPAE